MRKRTICNRDCPDSCGLVATVDGNRLVSVDGDPDHPVTRGIVCARTRRFPARQHHPDRLLRPLLRTSSGFREVGWAEALSYLADRLLAIRSESGPAAILHYRSAGSMGALGKVVDAFFAWFGPVTAIRGSACNGAGRAAQVADFGLSDGHDVLDLDHARNVVLWGKNPFVSHLHVVPWVQQVRRRGGKVVLVDPVHHASARLADRVIQPRPGADFHLACAVARKLVDEDRITPDLHRIADEADRYLALIRSRPVDRWARDADVSIADVGALADVVSDRPCAFLLGWGMARRSSGGAILRAIDALCALSGNVGIPGGGATYRADKRGAFASLPVPEPGRTLPEPQLGRAILEAKDPPIRAVWVTSGNPVVMLPDSRTLERALHSLDLVVVADSFLTDTARCASVVLPTATMFESDDLIAAYGHGWLGASVPVLDPPEGVLSDLAIVQRLAREIDARNGGVLSLGARLAGTARDWKERLAAPMLDKGVDVNRLEREAVRNPFAPVVPFEGSVFPTPTARMRLVHEVPVEPTPDSTHPLWLLSSSVRDAQGSQWSVPLPDVWPATCHPSAAPGHADGDEVMLCNDQGAMRVRLVFDDRQRCDVVVLPKGGPLSRGQCANVLVPDTMTDLGEGAAYLDARVRIERA